MADKRAERIAKLIEIDPQYPTVSADKREQLQAVKRELEKEAPEGAPAGPFAAREKAKAEAKEKAKAKARAVGQPGEGRA
jgi:hypothetical protein